MSRQKNPKRRGAPGARADQHGKPAEELSRVIDATPEKEATTNSSTATSPHGKRFYVDVDPSVTNADRPRFPFIEDGGSRTIFSTAGSEPSGRPFSKVPAKALQKQKEQLEVKLKSADKEFPGWQMGSGALGNERSQIHTDACQWKKDRDSIVLEQIRRGKIKANSGSALGRGVRDTKAFDTTTPSESTRQNPLTDKSFIFPFAPNASEEQIVQMEQYSLAQIGESRGVFAAYNGFPAEYDRLWVEHGLPPLYAWMRSRLRDSRFPLLDAARIHFLVVPSEEYLTDPERDVALRWVEKTKRLKGVNEKILRNATETPNPVDATPGPGERAGRRREIVVRTDHERQRRVRGESHFTKSARKALIHAPRANGLEICRSLDEDGVIGKTTRNFEESYQNSSELRKQLDSRFAKIRKKMRKERLLS